MGIDFMAIHCVNMETLKRLKRQDVEGGLVSRGGALVFAWMVENEEETPSTKTTIKHPGHCQGIRFQDVHGQLHACRCNCRFHRPGRSSGTNYSW